MEPTATAALLPDQDTVAACTVDPVTDYQGFLDLEPLWSRLVDEAGTDHPFLRHEWVRAWWECFGAGRELHVLVVKAGSEPVAIAPLMLSKRRLYGSQVRHMEFIWSVYAERFDVIVGPRRPKDAYRAISTSCRPGPRAWRSSRGSRPKRAFGSGSGGRETPRTCRWSGRGRATSRASMANTARTYAIG